MQLADLMVNDYLSLRLKTSTSSARMRRPISGVAPTELIEPSPYLEGNELITLAGIAMNFQDSRTWDAYVERLAAVPVAGIVFNSGIAHAEVPAGLISAGNSFDVPVFEVSPPVNMLQLYRLVNDTLQAERYAVLRSSLNLADQCAELEARGTTVLGLLEKIGDAVDGDVGLVDSQGILVASHPPDMNWPPAPQTTLTATRQDHAAGRHIRHLSPVHGGGSFSIVVNSAHSSATVDALLGPVGSIVSLHLSSTDESYIAENDRIRALVEHLRRPDEYSRRRTNSLFRAAGFDPRKTLILVAVSAGPDVGDAWRLRIQFSRALPTLGVVTTPECLIFLGQDFDEPTVTAAVVAQLVAVSPRRPAIVTNPLPDLSSVRTALLAAPKQLRDVAVPTVARRFDLPSVLATALTAGGVKQAMDFLEPLIAYDTDSDSDLVLTLRTFLGSDGSAAKTAQALFIHRNSLSYRLGRIGEILGVDLSSMDGKTTCTVALAVRDSQR